MSRNSMIPKQQFDKDEKVLCFHGELLYEAKVLEVEREHSTAPFRYRVHYKGWKNTWDDWVENDRLRKLNDENREIAQALKRQYLESTQKSTKPTVSKRKGLPSDLGSTRGSEERHASAPATGRGQKRGRNPDLEEVCDPDFLGRNVSCHAREDQEELLAAHSSNPKKRMQSRPRDSDLLLQPCFSKSLYTFEGSPGFLSPTESIKEILEEVYAEGERLRLQAAGLLEVAASPKIPTIPPRTPTRTPELVSTALPTPPPTVAGAKRKASHPQAIVQRPPRKKGRRAMWDEPDLDDSYEATRRALEKAEKEQLKRHQKEIADIVAASMVGVKELSDFPRAFECQAPPPFYPPRHRAWREAIDISKESNVDVSNEQEETFNNRPMVKIPIPDYIKSLLVDDWEEVTKNLALVPLPAQKPVSMILRDYVEEEKPKRFPGSADMDLLEEVVAGMKEYFDVALGRMLLYRFERQQYLDVRKAWGEQKGEWKDKTGPGDTYGAEHLCRMIVNMPEIIAQTNMDGQSVNRLREEMTKFLHWLNKNTKTYFLAKYETADQDYIEKSRAS
ncbi:MAG: hypothetical protein LQ346_002148 [Caloplaca aetnensis]|nr:MAG: hypothetical protein LQ346_002148 [Caloplaca aetnensis]